ncbi:MAG TPA: zinc-dependent metalloprotease [Acidimicrobiales bacterium]|nr:zinc-dependent metalloprotease [Acidimicrobiales bacterium]
MAVVVDTGVFVSAADTHEPRHEACAELLRAHRGEMLVPAPVMAETAWQAAGPVVDAETGFQLARYAPRDTQPGPTPTMGRVSVPGPFGSGNPFEGLFGELAKLFATQGPLNLEVARQLAKWLATEGKAEANVEPLERIRYEELARVAELHISGATGLAPAPGGGVVNIRPVGRGEWANLTLDAYRSFFEGLAGAMAAPAADGDPDDAADPTTELLGGVTQVVGPLLIGMQAGTMVGHLAQRAFGQYDLPVPRPSSHELLVVPSNVNAFATDWSLPLDDVRLWVCLTELAHHSIISRPHVHGRLDALLDEYVRGFRPDTSVFEERMGDIDPTDPTSFQAVLGDPAELLGAMQTPEQRQILVRVEALVTVICGYVDHVMDTVGRTLLGAYGPLSEALRRRRVERGDGDQFVERMFGLELGQAQYDRGSAFVTGVLERAGDEGLSRLWRSERELPTPPEVDAPGLWLERIDIPD